MAIADDIIKSEFEKRQTEAEKLVPASSSETAEKPSEELSVQTITSLTNEALANEVRTGRKDVREATVDIVKAAASAKAAADNADEYAEIAGQALTLEMKADTAHARSKERKASNEDNEAFYERYRPILEFDFGNITGNPKKRADDTASKSYSKLFMILTIIVAAIPWLVIALVLYVLKGVNAVVGLVGQFTKISQALIWAGLGILAAYIIVRIIAYYIEFYTGIVILPF